MGLLQEKLAKYTLPQQYMAMGIYPYFRTIDSHQDTEVEMDGKKVLMVVLLYMISLMKLHLIILKIGMNKFRKKLVKIYLYY